MRDNNQQKCKWCLGSQLYEDYHDFEWGRPVTDDKVIFEFLILESAQAGLSWITILKKRDEYRKVFYDFNVDKVAQMGNQEMENILNSDSKIIKNRLKTQAIISNARLFLEVQQEYGSFANYLWSYLPNRKPIINSFTSMSEVPAQSDISIAISKDMKKKGFKFFGPTICYAHMQATGMMNDHIKTCPSWSECADLATNTRI